jgi:uncharacterized protein
MIILLLVLVGLITGFINIFAGGGSLLSYPLLILLGLPVSVANGTNKLGLILGGFTGSVNFIKNGHITFKEVLPVAPVSLIGVFVGSKLSIDMDEKIYSSILAVVMIVVLAVIIFKPHKLLKTGAGKNSNFGLILSFAFIGFYAGFIQIGMGYLVIAVLSLSTDFSLLKITAYKVLIAGFFFVTVSAAIFVFYGKVSILYGISLGIGNAAGSYIGSNMAIKNGEKIINPILVISVIVMSIKISGIYKLFIQ